MPESSKEIIRNLFENKSHKMPFIPLVCGFAAKLEQVPLKTMLSDAGVLSRSLANAHNLFGYDAIVNIFDSSLEAEACGCDVVWPDENSMPVVASHPLSQGKFIWDLDTAGIENKGRIPAVLEATKRLTIIKGKEVAITAVVTGPLSLAGHLKGEVLFDEINQGSEEAEELIEETGNICLGLCRAYCELGVDVVVIAEETLGKMNPEYISMLASPLRSIRNVASYYNTFSIILGRGCNESHLEPVFGLDMDGVALPGNVDAGYIIEKALETDCCFGLGIPDSRITGFSARTENAPADYLPEKTKGLFLTTEWEVPDTTDINSLHEVIEAIRKYRGS